MKTKQLNAEVLIAEEPIVKVTRADIEQMKAAAKNNERKRIRLCAHKDVQEKLHEMIIVMAKGVYIRPHKHFGKAESFQVLEGLVDSIFFDESGKIIDAIQMGDFSSGKLFYYRIAEPVYHTLVVRSDTLVFHESTTGPFNRADTAFAPWSPDEKDSAGIKKFTQDLETNLARFWA